MEYVSVIPSTDLRVGISGQSFTIKVIAHKLLWKKDVATYNVNDDEYNI